MKGAFVTVFSGSKEVREKCRDVSMKRPEPARTESNTERVEEGLSMVFLQEKKRRLF